MRLGLGLGLVWARQGLVVAASGITVDSRVEYNSIDGTVTVHNWTHAVIGTADFVLVKLTGEGTQLPTGVTLNGVAMANHVAANAVQTNQWARQFFLAGSFTGALTIEVTLAGVETCGAESVGFRGVHAASPIADAAIGAVSGALGVTLSSALDPDGVGHAEFVASVASDVTTDMVWDSGITPSMNADSIDHRTVCGWLANVGSSIAAARVAHASGNNAIAASGIMLRAAA